MNRLVLIGVSHRRGGADALECYHRQLTTEDLHNLGFKEYVLMSTCNRWDVVLGLEEDALSLEAARDKLTLSSVPPYVYADDAALEQLSRIAASLDSLNPGEDQIMKQVRASFRAAQQAKQTGKTTSFAFNTALKIAKRVRREIDLAPLNTSLFSLARPVLEQKLAAGARVAILGTGEMGTLAAKTLVDNTAFEVVLVNRTVASAEQLAGKLKVDSMSLASFLQDPPDIAALVCATPVKDLIDAALLDSLPGLEMLVDLGLPRNVNTAAAAAKQIPVLDVDSLQDAGQQRRQEMMLKLAKAEQLIQQELALAMAEWTEKQLGPSIQKLRELYLQTIGDTLPEPEAQALANKFAHVPMKGLRAVAKHHGMAAAKTYLIETGLLDQPV